MIGKNNIQNAICGSDPDCAIKISSFYSSVGSSEFYISIEPRSNLSIEESLLKLELSYLEVLKKYKISVDSCVFCRIFLSDIENQKQRIYTSSLYGLFSNAATSVIGQTGVNGESICILIYHVESCVALDRIKIYNGEFNKWKNDVIISGLNYSFLWNVNYSTIETRCPYNQTEIIFKDIDESIKRNKMSFLGNSIRSWIYVRDIDCHYSGMVDARKIFFAHEELNSMSRYLASTGIEGQSPDIDSLISVDMLSICNIKPEQIVRMEALDVMSATIDYGVTFERGLRINFGDRSHLYVSGTASINNKGEVVHVGDAQKQTLLALRNIEMLLRKQGANLGDLVYLIVYIRDFASASVVRTAVFDHVLREIPMIVVKASVCRPSWLVEIEGVAILSTVAEFPPFL